MSKTLEEIITSPSLVREQWLSPELAVREVLAFERRFGGKHLMLACHAALPLILTPELVNLIHLNFLEEEQIPWIAEVDFLLSPLCRPIDEGLYEVEPSVREVLLVELENQFGFERPFGLAKFLEVYLAHTSGLQLRSEIIRTQQWIAQAYLDPDSLVVEMTNFLESSLSEGDNVIGLPEQIQVVTTLEILTEPIGLTNRQTEYQYLINNSRVFAYKLYGNFINITEGELIYDHVPSPTPSQQVSEPTIPELIQDLQDEDFLIRCCAAAALGQIGSEASITALIQALQDEDYSVRASAAESLGKIGSEATIPELIQALQDKKFSVRASAAEVLGRIGSETVIIALIQALEDDNLLIRYRAAEGLVKIASEASVPALIQTLKKDHSPIRASAVEALCKTASEASVTALIQALEELYTQEKQLRVISLDQLLMDKGSQVLLNTDFAYLDSPEPEASIAQRVWEYINQDPEGKLRNCTLKQYPDCNAQAVAKILYSSESYKANGQANLKVLAQYFNIPYKTFYSYWKRHCQPLLSEIVRELSNSTEDPYI